MAHLWARWLHNHCRLGDPHTPRSGGQNQMWPTGGQGGYITLPPRGSPPPQSGGQNQNWPTGGQGGYINPAASGIPTTSQRGAESELAHKWARWLHNHCRLGDPHTPRSGGQNQKWPTGGQGGRGYVATLPASGPLLIPPPALRRWGSPRWQGLCSHLAHLWATSDSAPRCVGSLGSYV